MPAIAAKHADSTTLLPLVVLAAVVLALSCGGDKSANPNLEPTASFTLDPASGTTETVFEFDASGSSDAEDPVSALQVRWDWENDGTWDTGWEVTKTADHQYATSGTKSIKLEVKDTGGATDDTTRGVIVTTGSAIPGEMVLVPAGTFTQGDGVAYCGVDQRQVTLTHNFYIGVCEVTNQEYRDRLQWAYNHGYVTATDASVRDNLDGSTQLLVDLSSGFHQISFEGGTFAIEAGKENHPVTSVCWYGAVAYCDWLSMNEGKTRAYNHSTWECNAGNPYAADGYRLPTDAEWEYAAKYNDGRIFPWGNEALDCTRSNSTGCLGWPVAVGSYPEGTSALGLYDMTGNVWEWCNDWEVCDLGVGAVTDPVGPATESGRVVHGGSFTHMDQYSRCAGRISYSPSSCYSYGGFRIARTQP